MEIDSGNIDKTYLLKDYASLVRYWRVSIRVGNVLCVQEVMRPPQAFVSGVFERWILSGRDTSMGFLSDAKNEEVTAAPGYSKHLLIIVNEKVLGDKVAEPEVRFRKDFFSREFSLRTSDGWTFDVRYRAPWVREMFRRFNLGGTLEYDPVDFIERLVEIISLHRPAWIHSEEKKGPGTD